ncbi:DUF6234 family protein [Streptomyces sp. LaPpAH-108]|uniref:DUF6234 family protein n=1 Tax=Streptomyces sp. LaPpAH-108 TaxID=1155714 RepID=UPI00037A191D|nr:DUF6234 family protein [Streptomyces sp. LaPpAH-108]
MTPSPPVPGSVSPPRRRRPWSRRTPTFADVSVALLLLAVEALVIWGAVLGYGLRSWGAQGERSEIDAAALAEIAWLRNAAVVVTVCAVLALLSRAPWTVASQVIVALAVGALLARVQHDYDRSHPVPVPTSTTRHAPCYSGSGTCE